ncbi:hypothetical protein CC86DRAFT_402235 [Ophiobolus disseminans]|uniref:Uncharacterized protein n=1 Tax=Ophiobolus disseminans TaxID=1469910 RepID=A0A6A7AGD1_9PLEO|nr:hypothetical protein CC86DRAFT_402235 [Ophiobolus disseminans]
MARNRAAAIVPSDFPDARYPFDIKFIKDPYNKGEVELEVFRELWDRKCIEVDNLPDADLRNPTHPCFARARFEGYSNDEQYEAIQPALMLASKFLADLEYIKFLTTLLFGDRVEFSRRVDRRERTEHYYEESVSRTMTAMRIKRELHGFSTKIKFFNTDRAWSAKDPARVGETFMDKDVQRCKRYPVFNADKECGKCVYCLAVKQGVCHIFQYRQYRRYDKDDLIEVYNTRGLGPTNGKRKSQLLEELEADDNTRAPCLAKPEGIEVAADRFDNIRRGLHADLKKHLVDQNREDWTYCEELRFQFGVAATLVHELTHSFWYFAQRRCWSCFKKDPWFSEEAPKQSKPECFWYSCAETRKGAYRC